MMMMKILTNPPLGCGAQERVRKLLKQQQPQLSVSSYDTAWVAMVPSPTQPHAPLFPDCLTWITHNQRPDGSWGLHNLHHNPKDSLLSTLACTLALHRWTLSQHQISMASHFIASNLPSATDHNLLSPIGFDIIFPGMLLYAQHLDLTLPLDPIHLNPLLANRDLELTRCHSHGKEAYLAYVSEGLGNLQDWNMVMKYQMKNGSLLNSPSTTAAALIHHRHDHGCLNYLSSLLNKFQGAVPTTSPLDLYTRLCMVDNLERLGIGRHFKVEIQGVLDDTYRCWMQADEQIFTDIATCAMAFRVLRMNGYDVPSDPLAQITKEGGLYSSLGGHFKALDDALEVYRASQIDESALGELNLWSGDLLKQKLSNARSQSGRLPKHVYQEVDDALKFPFKANLERLASRRHIEHYNVDSTRLLKTLYCSSNIRNKDFLKMAVDDFNTCQSIFREELDYLERWVIENKLDKLKFARQKAAYCYFSAAATLSSPELSDARISWAKNGILTTVVDDFFDVGGSMDELTNLIQLVEKWHVDDEDYCCSEQVRIVFLALQRSINEIGDDALKWQGRSVTGHIIQIWLDLMKSMLQEAEWSRDNFVPQLDEYMRNGYVSFALGPIILPALYLVGPKLSDEIVRSSEYENLYKLVSTGGRLLNDIQSFKREFQEGKLNAVALHMMHDTVGGLEEAAAVLEMASEIESKRTELLRLVLQEKGSVVPRACKDLFWNMSQILNLFYAKDDGFTSLDMVNTVKAVIHEPISISLDFD